MCQEILHSFTEDIEGVFMLPDKQSAGTFEISIDDRIVWERRADGGFPDASSLKKRVRDIISPERDLGHHDKTNTQS